MWFQSLPFCNLHRCQDWAQGSLLLRENSHFQQDGGLGWCSQQIFFLLIVVFSHSFTQLLFAISYSP